MPTTTIKAESRLEPAVVAKRRPAAVQVAVQGARRMTWKEVLVRELHALHVQQQERAFMATTPGSIYVSSGDVSAGSETTINTTLAHCTRRTHRRSEEHTYELQSPM